MSGIREQLQTIYEEHGQLTPALVVEAARPKSSPLHSKVFDVAPAAAAERYYLDRARALIRSVKVTYRDQDTDRPVTVRAFHAVAGPQGHVYEPLDHVADDPLLRALVLRNMEREWRQLHARYGAFTEFLALVRQDLEGTAAA